MILLPISVCLYLFYPVCDGRSVVPAQAAENHGPEGGPDREPAPGPHQRQAHAVRGPSINIFL